MNCRKRLGQVLETLPEIDSVGARIVGVVCQKRANVEAHFATNPVPFPMLVDEDRAIAKRWGVYHRLGIDAIHIAHPASFVLDGAGTVRLAEIAPSQFTRTPLPEIVSCLRLHAPR
jgi:peroxiredoxin